jgi:CheY-like chemotaxis protein
MAIEFEILSPTDRPVLVGVTAPDLQQYVAGVLDQLGYKVHTAATHDEFLDRFSRVQYEVVVLEDNFMGTAPAENISLKTLQGMPMMLRRHATVFVIGDGFTTLDPMQAFQQSAHAVVNRIDVDKLMLVVQQVVNDNAIFLSAYRDVQQRIAQGKK